MAPDQAFLLHGMTLCQASSEAKPVVWLVVILLVDGSGLQTPLLVIITCLQKCKSNQFLQ